MTQCVSPGLDDLMADPLIQATMRADRVDPAVLRRELMRVGERLATRPRPLMLSGARVRFGTESGPGFIGPRLARALNDCEKRVCC